MVHLHLQGPTLQPVLPSLLLSSSTKGSWGLTESSEDMSLSSAPKPMQTHPPLRYLAALGSPHDAKLSLETIWAKYYNAARPIERARWLFPCVPIVSCPWIHTFLEPSGISLGLPWNLPCKELRPDRSFQKASIYFHGCIHFVTLNGLGPLLFLKEEPWH